jgi:multicomponent Na+:H+ antiporter subunit E
MDGAATAWVDSASDSPRTTAISTIGTDAPRVAGGTHLRAFGLWATLYAFWLLLSGHYGPLLLVFGAASAALVVWFARRMDVLDAEGLPLQLAGRLLGYIPWLMKEIVVASVRVARVILTPKMSLKPGIVRYHASQQSDLGRALYANSITLTPGTITMAVNGDELEIHCLAPRELRHGEEEEMGRRVRRVEQGR